jgi:hypothetical protein
MTGVPESAFAGEGQEAGPAEPPERRCARCGAVGTHYLTCPGLRLPTGYRLVDTRDPKQSTEPTVTICRYMTT